MHIMHPLDCLAMIFEKICGRPYHEIFSDFLLYRLLLLQYYTKYYNEMEFLKCLFHGCTHICIRYTNTIYYYGYHFNFYSNKIQIKLQQ